jgi:hypothetical protein
VKKDQPSIAEDKKKAASTNPNSPRGIKRRDNESSRILFFKKGPNFSYQNIAISPQYHMVVE